MASSYSFDVVSEINLQEADNAVNQATKELAQRYDLRGSNATIDFDPKAKTIKISGDGEHFLDAIYEIIIQKFIKRGISVMAIQRDDAEPFGGKTWRQTLTLKNGLDRDEGKEVVKLVKDSKLKVTAQIQDEQVRVTGKDKDELQKTINLLKAADLKFPLQFINFR